MPIPPKIKVPAAKRPGGTAARRGHGPSQPLSRDRIVDAALALIHDDGLAAFSTRKLGERLGCEAMSIYHHFPSKQHLLDALVDQAISSVHTDGGQAEPIERLRHILRGY